MTALQRFVLVPLLAAFTFLAMSVDQAIYQSNGFLPLYSQVAILGLGIGGLAMLALSKDGGLNPTGSGTGVVMSLILLYMLWTAISYLYSPQNEIIVDTLIARTKFATFLILALVLFMHPGARSWFEFAAIGIVVFGVGICVYDFIQPTFSAVPGRAAGFYLNPNDAGFALILFALVASRRLPAAGNLALWAVVSVGVLVTFSRTAWLLLILSLFGLTLLGRFGGGRARFVFVGIVTLLFVLIFSAYLSGDLYLFVVRTPIAELLDANTLARLGARGLELDDYSSIEREDVLALGIARFANSPFLGYGVGSTLSWEESVGTHNMVVMFGAELGILGVALYLALFVFLLMRTRGPVRLLVVMLLLAGLTSHNMFDTIALSLPLGYAAASLHSGRSRQKPTSPGQPTIAFAAGRRPREA